MLRTFGLALLLVLLMALAAAGLAQVRPALACAAVDRALSWLQCPLPKKDSDDEKDAKSDDEKDAKSDDEKDAKPDEKKDAKSDEKKDAKTDEKKDAKTDGKKDADEKKDAKPDEKKDAKPVSEIDTPWTKVKKCDKGNCDVYSAQCLLDDAGAYTCTTKDGKTWEGCSIEDMDMTC